MPKVEKRGKKSDNLRHAPLESDMKISSFRQIKRSNNVNRVDVKDDDDDDDDDNNTDEYETNNEEHSYETFTQERSRNTKNVLVVENENDCDEFEVKLLEPILKSI